MTPRVEVLPWVPPPYARRLRHQANNLLVPLSVAAELLDDGSEAATLLTRSTDRLQRSMRRLGTLVSLGPPAVASCSVGALVERLSEVGVMPVHVDRGHTGEVRVDVERIIEHVVVEMRDNGADVTVTSSTTDAGPWLCLRSRTTGERIPEELCPHAGVPFLVRPGGVGLSLACRETHLHGGSVFVDGDTLDFLFPVVST